MECEFPTVNATNDEIKNILDSNKVIAVVGLSPKEDKDSHKVAKYMQEQGYKIIPIYPKEDTILGEKVYRSLSEVKQKVDIVNLFRKPAVALDVAQEILKRDDVKVFWLQKGIVNNEAAKMCEDKGIKVVQNKCIMVEHKVNFNDWAKRF